MSKISKIKSISIWIFILPFLSINICLILSTQFHQIYSNQEFKLFNSLLPYVDGGTSISRVARPFPNWLIFKPAMFLTSFLLIKYWLYNKGIISDFDKNYKHIKKIVFFGVGSAVALIIHSIFLGIEIDNNLYKLFRRVIIFVFIIFEITAQAYLVTALYSFKEELSKFINIKVLRLKLILISILIIVAITAIPIISWPGNTFKFVKHALEWDYFLGVITFYLLTYFMWKKKINL
ncbi:hypothetical protein [Candidatus Pelagibacter sp. Uisw_113]|uniref:hypothetical protein n=1 Tax=Candidatus Pelagibacter sp. Uisw_113 TaxID=3230994 RepID=UPI0039ED66C3